MGRPRRKLRSSGSGRLGYDAIKDAEPLTRLHGQVGIVTGRADIQFRWDGNPRVEGLYYTAVYGWLAPHWRMLAWQSQTSRCPKRPGLSQAGQRHHAFPNSALSFWFITHARLW